MNKEGDAEAKGFPISLTDETGELRDTRQIAEELLRTIRIISSIGGRLLSNSVYISACVPEQVEATPIGPSETLAQEDVVKGGHSPHRHDLL